MKGYDYPIRYFKLLRRRKPVTRTLQPVTILKLYSATQYTIQSRSLFHLQK